MEIKCITEHQDFHAVVLLKNVLRTALVERYNHESRCRQGLQFLTGNLSFGFFMQLVILQQ